MQLFKKLSAIMLLFLLVLSYLTACSAGRPAPQLNSSTNGANNRPGSPGTKKPVRVVFDNDGGVEDLVAMMLLMLDSGTELLMVSYVEAGGWVFIVRRPHSGHTGACSHTACWLHQVMDMTETFG